MYVIQLLYLCQIVDYNESHFASKTLEEIGRKTRMHWKVNPRSSTFPSTFSTRLANYTRVNFLDENKEFVCISFVIDPFFRAKSHPHL
jgi:hypothetical protein